MTLPQRLRARATWYSRIGFGQLRRAARRAISGAGIAMSKEFLVLDCAHGDDASGLFSEVAAVVGCIAEVTAHPTLYDGMRVDFQEHGLYYQPAVGPNWWEYYFERVSIGDAGAGRGRDVADWEHDAYASTVELQMPRADAGRIVKQYVVPKAVVRGEVERFWEAHFSGTSTVAVHYRGTDKWEGVPVVPYEAVAQAVIDASRSAGQPWKMFLATDEQACVEFMQHRFGGQVVARQLRRSTDSRPLHKAPGDGYRKGEDAVIDCLLLARAPYLVRTDSNLGLFSTFFNPTQTVRMFGQRT